MLFARQEQNTGFFTQRRAIDQRQVETLHRSHQRQGVQGPQIFGRFRIGRNAVNQLPRQ